MNQRLVHRTTGPIDLLADLVREFLASHLRLWIAGPEEWTRWHDSEFESGPTVCQVSLVDTGRCPLAVLKSSAVAGYL